MSGSIAEGMLTNHPRVQSGRESCWRFELSVTVGGAPVTRAWSRGCGSVSAVGKTLKSGAFLRRLKKRTSSELEQFAEHRAHGRARRASGHNSPRRTQERSNRLHPTARNLTGEKSEIWLHVPAAPSMVRYRKWHVVVSLIMCLV